MEWVAPDTVTLSLLQSWKGWAFVLVTSGGLLYALNRWEQRARDELLRRELLEHEANHAENRFQQMAENIGEVFWLTDLAKSQMLYVSPAYEAIWGRSRGELMENPRSWLESIHPDDRDRVLRAALEKQSQGLYDEEYRVVRPGGEVRWIRDRAFPVRDRHDQVYRVAGVATDITTRKLAERAGDDALARLHVALSDSSMCVWEWNMEGGSITWSEEASQLFGDSVPPDLDGFARWVHPQDLHVVMDTARRAIEQRQDFVCEFRVLMEDGRVLWLESRGRLRADGPTFLGTLADVTASKIARAVHERQALRMEAIVEFSADAIILADEQLRILDFNPGAERIFGYPSEQALGRSLLDLVPEGLRGEFRDRLSHFDPEGPARENRAGVQRGLRAGGEEFPQDATIAQLRLPGERLYTLTCRDITEHERAEERRQQLEERLRQTQKMEAVGQLAGGVAHDFNNLLTIVQGNTSLLQATPGLDEGSAAVLADVLQAAQRAAELTQQLLVFSRKQMLQPRQLDLSAVVRELALLLGPTLSDMVHLELELSDVPPVKADRAMMEQVVMSLALNARDAMPQGGRLLLRTREVTRTEEPHTGLWLELCVQDTGRGIPANVRDRIFEPFFTTKEVGQGSGLGLATAYASVEQHGGFIEVESCVGEGTTFRIFLPPAEQPPPPEAPAPAPTPSTGSEVVLVVEDDPGVRMLLKRILAQSGRLVLTAESGPAALEVWKDHKHHVQLLLTDMIMPGSMTGRQLALRLLEEKPHLRVLYTSGYSREELRSVAPEELEGSFLPKPYLPEQLMAAVSECLR